MGIKLWLKDALGLISMIMKSDDYIMLTMIVDIILAWKQFIMLLMGASEIKVGLRW